MIEVHYYIILYTRKLNFVFCLKITFFFVFFIFKLINSQSVMGGVCKIWFFIHRNVLIYDY